MNRRQYVIVVSFSVSLLTVALVQLSGQQGSSYNPWLDYNDDGIIDAYDLQALGQAYGGSGTPLNLPMALEYDSGWIDISDKQGQNITITHNLNLETSIGMPRIYGKTTSDGALHQRYFETTGYAPGWNKTYGKTGWDYGRSLVQTGDGGYAMAGIFHTSPPGANGYDFWLVKTDQAGNMEWNQTYGGTDADVANSIVSTVDGGYALAGYTRSYGAGGFDFWLVRTDVAGIMQWSQRYGGTASDEARCVVQTSDGGYALAGYTYSFGPGTPSYPNVYLVKTDASGNMEWNQTYGGANYDVAFSLVQTGDGGYAMAGYTKSYGTGTPTYSNWWLVKTDSAGNHEWDQIYGGTDEDYARSVIQTDDGGYAITGYTSSSSPSVDAWLIKTGPLGTVQWDKRYGGEENTDMAYSLVQTSDGGYALAGYTFCYGAVQQDFWLVKTDMAGTMQWSRIYGGLSWDESACVVQAGDGGYALCGFTYSKGAGNSDFWLVKTDPFGLETENLEIGLGTVDHKADALILYRGKIDPYWNYVRVRIWVVKENP